MAKSEENKVLTDNPLLDEIVWNAKMLARGVVLKDQTEADRYETLESVQNGDMLIAINQYNVRFDRFLYTEELLRKVPNISEEQVIAWSRDNSLIPENMQSTLLRYAVEDFSNNYIEKNKYYRMLHGEPSYDETGEWQGLWIDVNTIKINNQMPDISPYYISMEGTDYQLIHRLSLGLSEILFDSGAIDHIIHDDDLLSGFGLSKSDVLYLKYIGSRSIEYYDARVAERFEMLYCPSADSVEVEVRFKELLEANRLCTLYTVYSEAYKFQSDYYDRFMMIMIIVQTMIDMIVELPEYLIRRDVFDTRTCQYIFEANGVEYFPEIPIKFQVALVKNLNKLIKFKSTDKCLVDICSIFGCKSIQIFKYYILKDRKVTTATDLEYFNKEKEIEDSEGHTETVMDEDSNYDVKFVKVPILDSYDDYIRRESNIYDYDSIIDGDGYWNGDKNYDMVLEEIKDMDFTLLRSKYYSVEAMIDITERMFELVYFMNILLYNHVDKSKLLVSLPSISTKSNFELVDVILTLYSLSYIYYGVEDEIMDTQGKVLQILGFNFEADLNAIGEYLFENHGRLSLKDLHCEGFMIPEEGILTYKQLELIYTTNKDIYDHVMFQLTHPLKKEIYDSYMYIYKSLFITRLNMEYFTLPNGKMAETYTDFLTFKEPLLAAFLMEVKSINTTDKRQTACINAIQSITTYLKDYIDQDMVDFDNIFSGLPSISLDFIKKYVQKVIDFFKSFKIFTHDMSITYLFQDKFHNTIFMIDWILIKYFFEKAEVIKIEDWIKSNFVHMEPHEKIEHIDKIWLSIDRWIQRNFSDYYNEKWKDYTNIIRDMSEYYSHFDSFEEIEIVDEVYRLLVSIILSTRYDINDEIIDKIYTLEKEEFFTDTIQDMIVNMIVDVEYHQRLRPIDRKSYISFMDLYTRRASMMNDRIGKSTISQILNDGKYNIMDNHYVIHTYEG